MLHDIDKYCEGISTRVLVFIHLLCDNTSGHKTMFRRVYGNTIDFWARVWYYGCTVIPLIFKREYGSAVVW